MNQEALLAWLQVAGPPLLLLLMILNRIGVPTWATILLIAAGGMARERHFTPVAAVGCALFGLTVGDFCGYTLGRGSLSWVGRFIAKHERYRRTSVVLEHHGGSTVFLSRFLLIFLTVPVNLLAAPMRMPLQRFMLFAVPGNVLFVIIYFGLGYWFGGNWQAAWQLGQQQSPVVYIIIIVGSLSLAFGVWHWQRHVK